MNYTDYLTTSPEVMLGKPVIKGTRITVELILRKLSEGSSPDELTVMYPTITKDDIFAALSYSATVIASEELIAL